MQRAIYEHAIYIIRSATDNERWRPCRLRFGAT